ncbi:DUF6510 family protein [Agromyces sp. LHK192]|uniref:DUF6510 family protein n=1 Tax=Agromyces sp. LHK192 TaxID=2498704 RepID=UPI000FD9E2BB|nr:DUF6510 family protein [Agromyces sp. LHK192]
MQHLDGNALAGDLAEVFDGDLTALAGSCAHCGTRSCLATLIVYRTAMGSVGRCPACGDVLLVLAAHAGATRVDLSGIHGLETSDRGTDG